MIFDEATSSLDTETELLIQQSINSLKGERTIVIIAHRLSTVRNCDYIYVLKEGRIVDEGSFDELYKDKNSIFSKMCQAQNLWLIMKNKEIINILIYNYLKCLQVRDEDERQIETILINDNLLKYE